MGEDVGASVGAALAVGKGEGVGTAVALLPQAAIHTLATRIAWIRYQDFLIMIHLNYSL